MTLRLALVAAAVAGASLLSACAPLIVGAAAAGGTMVVTDRRTTGSQLEDQGIEMKAVNRAREVVGDRGRVNVTSYNRMALITGEVPTEADKANVEQAIGRVENLRAVVNELGVMPPASFTTRSNDLVLAGKVKASFIDAKDIQANAYKVVADRGTVYLMGRVTEREANRAAEIARTVSGVMKVVKVFEVVSEAELADGPRQPAPNK
jgi:osmotically-inducible protein OsmY